MITDEHVLCYCRGSGMLPRFQKKGVSPVDSDSELLMAKETKGKRSSLFPI